MRFDAGFLVDMAAGEANDMLLGFSKLPAGVFGPISTAQPPLQEVEVRNLTRTGPVNCRYCLETLDLNL